MSIVNDVKNFKVWRSRRQVFWYRQHINWKTLFLSIIARYSIRNKKQEARIKRELITKRRPEGREYYLNESDMARTYYRFMRLAKAATRLRRSAVNSRQAFTWDRASTFDHFAVDHEFLDALLRR